MAQNNLFIAMNQIKFFTFLFNSTYKRYQALPIKMFLPSKRLFFFIIFNAKIVRRKSPQTRVRRHEYMVMASQFLFTDILITY